MQVKLIVVNGQAKQREMMIELPAVVGRSRAAAVTIGDPLVSRQHCFLEEHGGMVLLRDNGSLNGTILDGQRVQGEVIIRPGAKLTVGPLTFVVIYEPTGDGAQVDTGLMPTAGGAAAGVLDFEALMAGTGDDAEEEADEEAAPDDADIDKPADEPQAAPAAEDATLQWLPPPATSAAPWFLPPLAAGPSQSPLLPPGAAKATAFDWLGGGAGDPADAAPTPPKAEAETDAEPPDDADEDQVAADEAPHP